MANVSKTKKGEKTLYFCNGVLYRTSKNDYKYACVATTRLTKGANYEGVEFCISLGNNPTSTLNSYGRFYGHCDLQIIEITNA